MEKTNIQFFLEKKRQIFQGFRFSDFDKKFWIRYFVFQSIILGKVRTLTEKSSNFRIKLWIRVILVIKITGNLVWGYEKITVFYTPC